MKAKSKKKKEQNEIPVNFLELLQTQNKQCS